MNLFARALSFLTFLKSSSKGLKSFNEEEAILALQKSISWFEHTLNDEGLPASSYSLLLNKLNGPSARTAANWLETFTAQTSVMIPFQKGEASVRQHADNLAGWLISIQRRDGTWPVGSSDFKNRPPSVFQMGIILSALISYSEKFGAGHEVSTAIERGVQWLINMRNENGGWDDYVFDKHLICTHSAALLIKAGAHLGNPGISELGKKSIEYFFSFQIGNGFFLYLPSGKKDYFASDYGFILYGFSKAAFLLDNRTYAEKLWQGLEPFLKSGKGNALLPGIINHEFNAPVSYYSVYGSVMALLSTLQVLPLLKTEVHLKLICHLANKITSLQMTSENTFIHGGFAVSQPSSGGYKPYEISGDAIALYSHALILLLNLLNSRKLNSEMDSDQITKAVL
jgi:hypothetical protein